MRVRRPVNCVFRDSSDGRRSSVVSRYSPGFGGPELSEDKRFLWRLIWINARRPAKCSREIELHDEDG
jgi:hypothetical protein